MERDDPLGKSFRDKIRRCNAAFAFTSLGYAQDERTKDRPGVQIFHVHGEVYHLQGPLDNADGTTPQYAQLFIYDPEFASEKRIEAFGGLDAQIIRRLSLMLHGTNALIEKYKTAHEELTKAKRRTTC